MKKILLIVFAFAVTIADAQIIDPVDSMDVETGIIYPANGVVDTIPAESLGKREIPQIPIEQCDSLMARKRGDRYGIMYINGKCGIYDLIKMENVTRVEFSQLWYANTKEIDGEFYTYFGWEEPNTKGVIGVSETTNQFVAISMPKSEAKEEEDEK